MGVKVNNMVCPPMIDFNIILNQTKEGDVQ